jgi:hypothetical protein
VPLTTRAQPSGRTDVARRAGGRVEAEHILAGIRQTEPG